MLLAEARLVAIPPFSDVTFRFADDGAPRLMNVILGSGGVGKTSAAVNLGALAASPRYEDVPVVYHTDHIKGPETLAILGQAVGGLRTRFPGGEGVTLTPSTVSLDSSELSPEDNIASIIALCRRAQVAGRDLTLEMEAGVDDGITETSLTERLLGEVEREYPGKVALWAPGLGTRHGYSAEGYPAFSAEAVARHRDTARQVTGRAIGIALHGSSGLSEESLGAAVSQGVAKVNWSTESLLVRSRAQADYYGQHTVELTAGHPGFKPAAADNGVQEFTARRYVPVVVEKIRVLRGENKSPGILPRLRTASASPVIK